jgi:hypothetical protein
MRPLAILLDAAPGGTNRDGRLGSLRHPLSRSGRQRDASLAMDDLIAGTGVASPMGTEPLSLCLPSGC